ncbi:unnamed protein product [Toxocara canis]|uniref:TBC1 domain family member 8 n=1 Tax=Toxocara canis TaxID=6265 RepID=A0A183TWJ9_TOXCA|nr:unnamed protein product [Toxocara canis]
MDEQASLPDSLFNQLCYQLKDVLSSKTPAKPNNYESGDSDLTSPELDDLRGSFQTFEMHSPRLFFINQKRRPGTAASAVAFTFPGDEHHQPKQDVQPGGPSSA